MKKELSRKNPFKSEKPFETLDWSHENVRKSRKPLQALRETHKKLANHYVRNANHKKGVAIHAD